MKNEELTYRMERLSAVIRLICIICVSCLLASCVKDTLYHTPHPDQGVVAMAIDLPEGAGSDDYTVEIDGTPLDREDGQYTVSDPLTPGEHEVLAYNTPQGFTVTDGIARVDAAEATGRALSDLIVPLPEHLYSGTERILVMADDTVRVDLDVARRTRDLHIELTVTEGDPERIASISGTLSGVAGAYDLHGETLYGEAVSTGPTFTRSGDKVTADLRLLGTMGGAQTLTLQIAFTDRADVLTVESDLTEVLADFNSDMTTDFRVAGTLKTPVGMEESDAEITGWETVTGDPVTAE